LTTPTVQDQVSGVLTVQHSGSYHQNASLYHAEFGGHHI
jgi:hypothetical protein